MDKDLLVAVLGPFISTASVITTIILSNRTMASQHKSEADRLDSKMAERVTVLETKMNSWMDRISTFERHIQKQIDDLKLRLSEIEKEMRREKSVR